MALDPTSSSATTASQHSGIGQSSRRGQKPVKTTAQRARSQDIPLHHITPDLISSQHPTTDNGPRRITPSQHFQLYKYHHQLCSLPHNPQLQSHYHLVLLPVDASMQTVYIPCVGGQDPAPVHPPNTSSTLSCMLQLQCSCSHAPALLPTKRPGAFRNHTWTPPPCTCGLMSLNASGSVTNPHASAMQLAALLAACCSGTCCWFWPWVSAATSNPCPTHLWADEPECVNDHLALHTLHRVYHH